MSLSPFSPWYLAHGISGGRLGASSFRHQNLESREVRDPGWKDTRREVEAENRADKGVRGGEGPADGLVARGSTYFHFIFIQVTVMFLCSQI